MSEWDSNWKQDDEDHSEDEEYDERFIANKFASVLIVDNTPEMFDIIPNDEDDNSYFKMIIISLLNTLQKLLFKRFYQNVAVIFLNDKQQPLIEFNSDLKSSIKQLNRLKYKSNETLKNEFVCDANSVMCVHEAMHTAVTMFKKNEKLLKNSHKHVAIITNEPSPVHCKNDDGCNVTVEEFQTFQIEFVVLPLVNDFKWKDFYMKMLNRIKENEPVGAEELGDEGYVGDDLSYVVEQLIQTNTNITRTIFRYGNVDSSFFHVQVKKCVDVKKLFHQAKVNPEDGQRVFKQTQSAPNAEEERPYINREDRSLRSRVQLPIGITLLYVSEKRSTMHYLQHDLFVMIEDDQVDRTGYDVLFDYFWEFCSKNKKVLICTYHKGYVKQTNYLIELKPDHHKGKPCFVGQYLCYANVAKNFTPYVDHVNETVSVDVACDLVKKLTIKADRAMHFSDPKYDYKTRMIKGHLLSDKDADWREPDEGEVPPQFPGKDDVFDRIGKELSDEFRLSYIPKGENKRKRGKD